MTDQKVADPETVEEASPGTTVEKTEISTTPHHGDEMVGGALTGAIGGAVIGAVVGGPLGAIAGGTIGAVTGTTIGAVDTRKKDGGEVVVTTRTSRR